VKLKVLEEAREQYLAERAWWLENTDHSIESVATKIISVAKPRVRAI